MNQNNYKNTETGLIPVEWEVKKFRELGTIGRGKSKNRPRDAAFLFGGNYPFVQTGDIKKANLYLTEYSQTYSEAGLKQSKLWQEGTLCITIAANIAETAILKINACFPDSIIGFTANPLVCDTLFIKYSFDVFKNEIQSKADGGAQDNLNQDKLEKITFKIPPLPEQQKIAQILLAWDMAIEKLSSLIAKKKLRKKALMQQVFSQKLKFKAEDGSEFPEWELKNLGEVFDFIRTESLSRENLTYNEFEGDIYYIHYGDIHATFKKTVLDFTKVKNIPLLKDSIEISNNSEFLKDGDLAIVDASEDYAGVGQCIEMKNIEYRKVLGGLHTIVIRDNKGITLEGFRGYILKNPSVSLALKKLATGASVFGVSKGNLSKLIIPIPSIAEQQKIAKVLTLADKEIEELEKQHAALKQQKQGLMQELLTGKRRVKI